MISEEELRWIVAQRVAEAGSQRALANKWKCPEQDISSTLRGSCRPLPSIRRALKLRPIKRIVYHYEPEPA